MGVDEGVVNLTHWHIVLQYTQWNILVCDLKNDPSCHSALLGGGCKLAPLGSSWDDTQTNSGHVRCLPPARGFLFHWKNEKSWDQ